jgi:hypothetical protein
LTQTATSFDVNKRRITNNDDSAEFASRDSGQKAADQRSKCFKDPKKFENPFGIDRIIHGNISK